MYSEHDTQRSSLACCSERPLIHEQNTGIEDSGQPTCRPFRGQVAIIVSTGGACIENAAVARESRFPAFAVQKFLESFEKMRLLIFRLLGSRTY